MSVVSIGLPQGTDQRQAPANIEAEQALLGCVLYDNEAFHRVDGLEPDHFYEPFHRLLWTEICRRIGRGVLAEPILMDETFKAVEAYQTLGGLAYLANLVDAAPPANSAPSYSAEIIDIALRREVIRISNDAIERAEIDRDHTGREIVDAFEQDIFSLGENTTRQGFQAAESYIAGAVEMAGQAFSRDGAISGVSTGLIDLDRKLGGMHPSDLLILAARPSMGKTSLAVNIACDVAKNYRYEVQPDGTKKTVSGGVVGFFSLEMSAQQHGLRLLAEVSGVSGDRLRKGEIDINEFGRVRDAAETLRELPLFVDDTGGITLAKLAARARRMKRTHGLDLIVVDYLQLVTAPGRKGEGRVQEVSEITQGLKALAKDLDVPVLALSQLSRQVENREDKRPQLSDLRESGSIEQDADMVMFIYRESYYLGRSEPKPGTQEHLTWQDELNACQGLADVIVAKQRHGPIGTVRLTFNEDLTKFGNVAHESHFAGAASHRLPYGDDQ